MNLPQSLANHLFELEKVPISRASVQFPTHGSFLTIECFSRDRRYNFQADINRKNKINLKKISFQLRHNKALILSRLCLNNGVHDNPEGPAPLEILKPYEGVTISQNHVHVYIEGFNDRWAIPLEGLEGLSIDMSEPLISIMNRFFVYCNIKETEVMSDLFSS